jgi:5-methyltetrahydropteroyltriglutamate--homocysteine methyltransferase
MTVALHLCRGNFRGAHLSQGGYDEVAEAVFGGLEVDGYFLEYDTERAGGFAPLGHMPPDKSVVLGLISSKTGALESRRTLTSRIDEAARIVPLERLGLSPQCGFASAVTGNPVTEADQAAKLGLVVEIARDVWGEP